MRRRRRRTRAEAAPDYSMGLTTAVYFIIFSLVIMLFFGWECHSELVPGWPLGSVEELCGPVYEVIGMGLLLLFVGIALIAYVAIASRGRAPREVREQRTRIKS